MRIKEVLWSVVVIKVDEDCKWRLLARIYDTGRPDDIWHSTNSTVEECPFSPHILLKHDPRANRNWKEALQAFSVICRGVLCSRARVTRLKDNDGTFIGLGVGQISYAAMVVLVDKISSLIEVQSPFQAEMSSFKMTLA
jgi:hypothetical protein